jgi:hypothetical protein
VLLDGRLTDQAQQAVYGEGRQQVMHAELKALTAGMVKGTIPPASVINAMAERRIADTRVRDVRPGQFLMAARRASQRAFDLLSTHQDRAGAVQAKQQELINLALYREATKAQEAVDGAVSLSPLVRQPRRSGNGSERPAATTCSRSTACANGSI